MPRSKFFISSVLRDQWVIDDRNILDSKTKKEGYDIFKFCYSPETGEFLCDVWPSNHREIMQTYDARKFNDYVRGIYFKTKRIVYLREHENKAWLVKTREFLRQHGARQNTRVIWGKSAARELDYELKGL